MNTIVPLLRCCLWSLWDQAHTERLTPRSTCEYCGAKIRCVEGGEWVRKV